MLSIYIYVGGLIATLRAAGCGWGRAGRCVDPRRTPLNNASMRQHKAHRLRNRAPTRRRRPVVLLARAVAAVTPAACADARRAALPSRCGVWPRARSISSASSPLPARHLRCWTRIRAATEIGVSANKATIGCQASRSGCLRRGSVKRMECIHGGPRENTSEPKARNGSQLDPGAAHAAREPLGGGHLAPI
jgi:hypothetical protein